MKKFTLKAIALATASICGSAAFAGEITAPTASGPGSATAYAVEGLAADGSTNIILPAITYKMGVARTSAQDFTMVYKPSAGSTFAACPVAPGAFTAAGTNAIHVLVSNKRSSATECAYEVDIGHDGDFPTTTDLTLSLAGLTLDTSTLAAGTAASVVLGLFDLGESARIDNGSDLSRVVASSGHALTLAAVQDTQTTTNVNHLVGTVVRPLFGFVADGDDTTTVATATFRIGNNSGTTTFMQPDGVTPWDFKGSADPDGVGPLTAYASGTGINITVTGNFGGMATDGLTVEAPGTNPTVSGTGGTRTFTLLPANIGGQGSNTDVSVSFLSAETVSLGTSRTFGVAGVGDVATGADVALAGNTAWWVWDANASQLMTPYFTTNSIFLSRFFFLNTGADSVGYTADCYSETGNAITYGAGRSGTLTGNGTTAVNASSVCTFAGAARGSIIFTISAPINTVKGSYQYIDQVTLNGANTPMVRPYGNSTTE